MSWRETLNRRLSRRATPGSGTENYAPVVPHYAPEMDGEPDPGEVVWAWVPYEDDPAQGKDRPGWCLPRREMAGSG